MFVFDRFFNYKRILQDSNENKKKVFKNNWVCDFDNFLFPVYPDTSCSMVWFSCS